ncbi:MAG: site-specific DNA-methyltransferase [Ignavibacteria bacterium]|jgi:site-specific DNA-methyltransferase (adenine-specific)|nr:site-specific DNA-methyltransferase [Ignavibacteria bacterium]
MENKSSRNKTLKVSEEDVKFYSEKLLLADDISPSNYINKTILGNTLAVLEKLPDEFADLIIIDPPYNLTKDFNKIKFKSLPNSEYIEYLTTWFPQVCKKLKSTGSLYLCGDWKCTAALQTVLEKELTILNRITWQREKGRGAKANWKNSMEDIWFAVKNPKKYTFNINAVKIKRKVLAPYRVNGVPKDWEESDKGKFRKTYPSNFWDDITVPFWSMLENTIHPTQKPEKLIAKLILASSKEGDIVFDPFLGSGTTSVVAKKLNRNYCGIEIDKEYAVLAEKRLELASSNKKIQGYEDGVFWERNTR